MKDTKRWLPAVALVAVGLCSLCGGAIPTSPIDSVCEVSFPKGSGNVVGSGVCVRNQGEVWTLTNAHVIRNHRGKIYTQWVWKGATSKKLEATEVWRLDGETIDMALLRQPVEPFGGRLPRAAEMLPEGVVLPKGSLLYTIGCPGGANPTLLECRLVAYQQHRAGMILSPRVESGRSGSPVFSADGRYLVGLVDSWDRDQPSLYGSALYASQLRHTLSKMIPQAAKPIALVAKPAGEEGECRLFDGTICNRLGCNRHGNQQQVTPPGTGQAYPQLPPLAGIGEPTVGLPTLDEVDNLRERLEFLELSFRDVATDLEEKEAKLKALFGDDYQLMKDIAADARAAKTTAEIAKSKAEDASRGVGILTDKVIDLPGTIVDTAEAAVEAKLPQDIDHWGVIRDGYYDVKAWREELEGEDGEGGRLGKIAAIIRTLSNPIELTKKLGVPLVILLVLIVVVWIRVERKRERGEEFRTPVGDVLARGTGAADALREGVADAVGDVLGDLRDLAGRIVQRRARRRVDDLTTEIVEMAGEGGQPDE